MKALKYHRDCPACVEHHQTDQLEREEQAVKQTQWTGQVLDELHRHISIGLSLYRKQCWTAYSMGPVAHRCVHKRNLHSRISTQQNAIRCKA